MHGVDLERNQREEEKSEAELWLGIAKGTLKRNERQK